MKIHALFYLIFISLPIFANEFSHCNNLFVHGINNITSKKDAQTTQAFLWHRNCGSNFSSFSHQKLKTLEAGIFGYGSGSGKSLRSESETRISNWCEENKEEYSHQTRLVEEARFISDNALLAWNNCQEIAKDGLNISPTISGVNAEYVTITIDSNSGGTFDFYGVTQDGYSCTIYGLDGNPIKPVRKNVSYGISLLLPNEGLKVPEINNKNIHVACTRAEPEVTSITQDLYSLKYDNGYIQVLTSDKAFPLFFGNVKSDYYTTPAGMVAAFDHTSCPDGWSDYRSAYGRFIRGFDPTGTVNKTGQKIGETKEDMVKSHRHAGVAKIMSSTTSDDGSPYHSKVSNKAGLTDQNVDSKSKVISETHPKNVALLYCIKK